MGIILKNIRVKNFRSLENIDVELEEINILIGQNNAGKSNFLKAVDIVFNGSRYISEDDIYIGEQEHLLREKKAIIDVKIYPYDEGKIKKEFSDFWANVFTTKWITVDEANGSYVGIRTIIEYDEKKNDYGIVRKPITEWNNTIENSKTSGMQTFTNDMYDYLNSYYMDAQRDILRDIKNRKSYLGRAISKTDLSDQQIQDLEDKLNSINQEIIGNIPAIAEINTNLSKIAVTLGSNNSEVQMEPLARKISDLNKGMDLTLKEAATATFSVAQHGMGTRSWVSFLTLGVYTDYVNNSIKKEDAEAENYVLLSLEEPEAHLHPQAQRQLYQQLTEFRGQKIVSTHSASVLAQTDFENILHFKKIAGKTQIHKFYKGNYNPEEISRIRREVINTNGELVFSTAIVLCEGVTEQQALPVYFKEFFGIEPLFLGINIIGIGGKNYKTYLKFIKEFDLKWYIFSDGEAEAIKSVKNAVKIITDNEYTTLNNVIVIENGYDYEKMLIKNGNSAEIILAINLVNNNDDYYENYIKKQRIEWKPKRIQTDKVCEACGQYIFEDEPEPEIAGFDEEEKKMYKCMTSSNGKAKYALPIAEQIVKDAPVEKRFPREVLALFIQMETDLGLKRRSEYYDIETIRETAGDCKF